MADIKKPGLVWVPGDRGMFRPFEQFREIRKGKNRGRVEIILRPSKPKKIIVDKESIRTYPTYSMKGEPDGNQTESSNP